VIGSTIEARQFVIEHTVPCQWGDALHDCGTCLKRGLPVKEKCPGIGQMSKGPNDLPQRIKGVQRSAPGKSAPFRQREDCLIPHQVRPRHWRSCTRYPVSPTSTGGSSQPDFLLLVVFFADSRSTVRIRRKDSTTPKSFSGEKSVT